METMTRHVALFPGCSLEGSANAFEASLAAVFRVLGIRCETLRDWSCCGATSAHAVDHRLHLALNLRNLALAEAQGFEELLAPCAACYHRLAAAENELRQDAGLLAAMNAEAGMTYRGTIRVRNVLDVLANDVGSEAIGAQVTRPLRGLRVACYYGCLNTRIPRKKCFDDREYPMSMDRLVRALGARPVDWSYKTECCGASMFITMENISARLVSRILKDAIARGAECIAVACPMCHNNLDTKQADIRAAFDISRAIPTVLITQLIGLAFGLAESELKLHHNFVPLDLTGQAVNGERAALAAERH